MRYINLFLFLSLFVLYFALSSQIKFSTNFLEIFFSQKSMELFDIAKKLGVRDEILIAKKGFEQKSLEELSQIADELKELPQISHVEVKSVLQKDIKEYIQKHYFLLAEFDNKKIDKEEIKRRLKKIYDGISTSLFYTPINTYDPLEIFSLKSVEEQKTYTKLKDFGYILKAKVSIDTSNANQSRELYRNLNMVLSNHSDVISIAPFFYLVENSAHIRSDAQTIMIVATIMLLILYFFILKNHRLFFNTILAIGSSILSAILATWLIFDTISILSLVFGISITTISIDYMFHYYFHNSFSSSKPIFEKKVFLGFLTTFGVFVIFSFIDVELFSQLAVFSAISLSVAYMIFSWTFIYLDITPPKQLKNQSQKRGIKPLHVIVISVLMLTYVYSNLNFDSELKNLDYQNKKLISLTKKFSKGLEKKSFQVLLLNAKTKEELLERYEVLSNKYPNILGIGKFVLSEKKCKKRLDDLDKYDFSEIKNQINKYEKKIGFKEGTFKNAYSGIDKQKCSFETPNDIKFKIIKERDSYYTIALVDKNLKVENSDFVEVVDLAKSLKNDTQEMKKTLSKYALISLIFILIVLFFVAGKMMLYPLTYLLFPMSTALFAITLMGKINIMHMFALVILLAISIDYGIYMYKTKTPNSTKKAIFYALMSTFSGFGVLIFSTTVALYSIGLVITIGIGAIFLLLYASL